MNKSKKSLQSYILGLFFVSLIMAFLLVFILESIYDGDIEKCKYVDFDITDKCVADTVIRFVIKNNFNETLNFKINDKNSIDYMIPVKESKKINILKGPSKITFLPILSEPDRDYECKGKVQVVNTEIITKCIKD